VHTIMIHCVPKQEKGKHFFCNYLNVLKRSPLKDPVETSQL
jgi:hypothetical protein